MGTQNQHKDAERLERFIQREQIREIAAFRSDIKDGTGCNSESCHPHPAKLSHRVGSSVGSVPHAVAGAGSGGPSRKSQRRM